MHEYDAVIITNFLAAYALEVTVSDLLRGGADKSKQHRTRIACLCVLDAPS